jgi:hypothetical protein
MDSCEINLLAARVERAQSLSSDGLLVLSLSAWEPDNDAQRAVIPKLKRLDFASAFPHLFDETISLHPDYCASLAAYAVWCDLSKPTSIRCGALNFAFTTLHSLCSHDPSAARLSTLARIAWDWGKREVCVKALASIINPAMTGKLKIAEPFCLHRSALIVLVCLENLKSGLLLRPRNYLSAPGVSHLTSPRRHD